MGSSVTRVLLLTAVFLLNLSFSIAAKEEGRLEARSIKDLKPGVVVQLTDTNFDILIQKDVWLVDVYASWCSHCRQLEPVWRQVATDFQDQPDIHVAKIDAQKHKALASRLQVAAFPSIFLLRDKSMWAYTGPRTVEAIMEFATNGYKTAKALPVHRCPNHPIGRLLGFLYMAPVMIREAYLYMREEKGWSDLTILMSVLAVPLVSGVATICLMDALYVRKARMAYGDEAGQTEDVPEAVPAEDANVQ